MHRASVQDLKMKFGMTRFTRRRDANGGSKGPLSDGIDLPNTTYFAGELLPPQASPIPSTTIRGTLPVPKGIPSVANGYLERAEEANMTGGG